METIAIKENCDDPKERARRAAARKKQKELEAAKQKLNKPVSFLSVVFEDAILRLCVSLVR